MNGVVASTLVCDCFGRFVVYYLRDCVGGIDDVRFCFDVCVIVFVQMIICLIVLYLYTCIVC